MHQKYDSYILSERWRMRLCLFCVHRCITCGISQSHSNSLTSTGYAGGWPPWCIQINTRRCHLHQWGCCCVASIMMRQQRLCYVLQCSIHECSKFTALTGNSAWGCQLPFVCELDRRSAAADHAPAPVHNMSTWSLTARINILLKQIHIPKTD